MPPTHSNLPTSPLEVVNGRYQLIGVIGKGGQAVVYKAVDRQRQNQHSDDAEADGGNSQTDESTTAAADEEDERQFVAVKKVEVSAGRLADLEREVGILQSMAGHPNIIRYIDECRTKAHVYIVIEYARRGSLLTVLKEQSKGPKSKGAGVGGGGAAAAVSEQLTATPADEEGAVVAAPRLSADGVVIGEKRFENAVAASHVAQVLHGLLHLHKKGVLHRDIKAANVLLMDGNTVKLTDFGLAAIAKDSAEVVVKKFNEKRRRRQQQQQQRQSSGGAEDEVDAGDDVEGDDEDDIGVSSSAAATSAATGANSVVGSVYWMAPELIKGDASIPITAAADVWAIGCLAVELLTGNPPFYDRAPVNALYCIAELSDVPPVATRVMTPEAVAFIGRCLHPDPTQRSTVEALLADPWLKQGLGGSAAAAVNAAEGGPAAAVVSPDAAVVSRAIAALERKPDSAVVPPRLLSPRTLAEAANQSVYPNPADGEQQQSEDQHAGASSSAAMPHSPLRMFDADNVPAFLDSKLFSSSDAMREQWLRANCSGESDELAKCVDALSYVTPEDSFRIVRSLYFFAEQVHRRVVVHGASATAAGGGVGGDASPMSANYSPIGRAKGGGRHFGPQQDDQKQQPVPFSAPSPMSLAQAPLFYEALGRTALWDHDLHVMAASDTVASLFVYCCCYQDPNRAVQYAPSHGKALRLVLRSDFAPACADALQALIVLAAGPSSAAAAGGGGGGGVRIHGGGGPRNVAVVVQQQQGPASPTSPQPTVTIGALAATLVPTASEAFRAMLLKKEASNGGYLFHQAVHARFCADGADVVLKGIVEDYCGTAVVSKVEPPTLGWEGLERLFSAVRRLALHTSSVEAEKAAAADPFGSPLRTAPPLPMASPVPVEVEKGPGGILQPSGNYGAASPATRRAMATDRWIGALQEASYHKCPSAILMFVALVREEVDDYMGAMRRAQRRADQQQQALAADGAASSPRGGFFAALIGGRNSSSTPATIPADQLPPPPALARALTVNTFLNIAVEGQLPDYLKRSVMECLPLLQVADSNCAAILEDRSTSIPLLAMAVMAVGTANPPPPALTVTVGGGNQQHAALSAVDYAIPVLVRLCEQRPTMAAACASYPRFLPIIVSRMHRAMGKRSGVEMRNVVRLACLLFEHCEHPAVFVTSQQLVGTLAIATQRYIDVFPEDVMCQVCDLFSALGEHACLV